MALTGFDPALVKNSIGKVNNAYSQLISAIGDEMQTKFVNGMSDKWACSQAQTFFNESFKPTVEKLIKDSTATFQSVIEAMNSAAKAWAESTDTSYNPTNFSAITKVMSTDVIQENIGGVRGIDLSAANNVAAQLSTIVSSAQSALSSAKNAVVNCGFVNGNQEASLVGALQNIGSKINDAVSTISDQTKQAIDTTVSTYSDLEGRVSQAFSGQ